MMRWHRRTLAAALLAMTMSATAAPAAVPVKVDPAAVPLLRPTAVGYAQHALLLSFADSTGLPDIHVHTGMRASRAEPAIDTVASHMHVARVVEGVIAFDCSGAPPKLVRVSISAGAGPTAATFVKDCNAAELVKLLGAIANELRSPELAARYAALLQQALALSQAGSPGASAQAAIQPVSSSAPAAGGAAVVPAPSSAGAATGNVHLNWEAPDRMSNGERIRGRIAKYHIYGTQSPEGEYRLLDEVAGDQTSKSLQVASGQWFFAVTAVLPDKSESAYSAEVSKVVP